MRVMIGFGFTSDWMKNWREFFKTIVWRTKCETNRPFPSSLVPLFQSESMCETILMTLICMKMKLHAELIFM